MDTKAVERYLLGEMAQDERDEFEEHYFACAECAADIRAGARFRANAREVLSDPGQFSQARSPRRGFFSWNFPSWAPAAASVLLLGVVIYQAGFEIPSLRRQAAVQSIAEGTRVVRLHETTRGASGIDRIPAGSGTIILEFDIISDKKQSSYACTIMDASGKIMASPVIESPEGDEPALIQLHREFFSPGRYSIAVHGASGTLGSGEILSKFEFEIH